MRARSGWIGAGVVLLSAAVLPACGAGQSAPGGAVAPQGGQYTVARVIDGDTVLAKPSGRGGPRVRVRILGIDTPETKRPHTPVQCGGPEASAFAHRLLDRRTVRLAADATQQDRDRYGRLLRSVRLPDGRDYARAVLTAGLARTYIYQHRPVADAGALAAAQRSAQQGKRGIWGPLCHGDPAR